MIIWYMWHSWKWIERFYRKHANSHSVWSLRLWHIYIYIYMIIPSIIRYHTKLGRFLRDVDSIRLFDEVHVRSINGSYPVEVLLNSDGPTAHRLNFFFSKGTTAHPWGSWGCRCQIAFPPEEDHWPFCQQLFGLFIPLEWGACYKGTGSTPYSVSF